MTMERRNDNSRPLKKRRLSLVASLEDDSSRKEVLGEASRPQLGKKGVRFSTEAPQEVTFSLYEAGMTEEERIRVRTAIWYTRKEFDNFLRDRVQTIRVWRSCGEFTDELNQHYSLRGLEPYQSPSLNAEMHSHRYMHHQTVFKEQTRQRRVAAVAARGEDDGSSSSSSSSSSRCRSVRNGTSYQYDPVRIHDLVSHMSAWALQRAQRLALLDARDAAEHQGRSLNTVGRKRKRSTVHRGRRVSTSNTTTHEHVPPQQQQQQQMSPRQHFYHQIHHHRHHGYQTPAGGLSSYSSVPYGPRTHTPPMMHVDVHRLKEWNMRLLQQVTGGSQNGIKSEKDNSASQSDRITLNDLMTSQHRDSLSLSSTVPSRHGWSVLSDNQRIEMDSSPKTIMEEAEKALAEAEAAILGSTTAVEAESASFYYAPVRRDSLCGLQTT